MINFDVTVKRKTYVRNGKGERIAITYPLRPHDRKQVYITEKLRGDVFKTDIKEYDTEIFMTTTPALWKRFSCPKNKCRDLFYDLCDQYLK